jgi:hypothetical protein
VHDVSLDDAHCLQNQQQQGATDPAGEIALALSSDHEEHSFTAETGSHCSSFTEESFPLPERSFLAETDFPALSLQQSTRGSSRGSRKRGSSEGGASSSTTTATTGTSSYMEVLQLLSLRQSVSVCWCCAAAVCCCTHLCMVMSVHTFLQQYQYQHIFMQSTRVLLQRCCSRVLTQWHCKCALWRL